METRDTLRKRPSHNGLLAAVLFAGLAPVAPAFAQCTFDLSGVVVQPNCPMEDGTIQLLMDEGTQVFSIQWSNGYEGSFQTDLGPGTYTVVVTTWDDCVATAEFVLACPEEPPVDDNCTLRTQTQGGWGSSPNGNNPGAYLHANFAAAFPNGITIGCTRKLRLTTAQAVTNYLPSGGPAGVLPVGTLTNPTNYKNVLAAQLVAATISVGMDAYDTNFGFSGNSLGGATVNSGPFTGYTVQQVLDMANNFIGSCGNGGFTATQYNQVLSSINENFVDGTTDNGFLSCGGGTRSMRIAAPELLTVFPNPASAGLQVRFSMNSADVVSLELLDLTGRVALPARVQAFDRGVAEVAMDVSTLSEGIYFVRITQGQVSSTMRVVVSR
jgi:hypothetical protein